ncbi:MAG: hypothetical protein AAF632_27915 [Bacteroidota bacterium]
MAVKYNQGFFAEQVIAQMNRYSDHRLADANYDQVINYGHGRFEQRTA